MKRILFFVGMVLLAAGSAAWGDDLYKVIIRNNAEASFLIASGAEAVLVLDDGYLVLADHDAGALLETGGLDVQRLETDLMIDQLAVDRLMPPNVPGPYPVLYEAGGIRLCRVDGVTLRSQEFSDRILPVQKGDITITWKPPQALFENIAYGGIDLDSLIALVDIDSVRHSVGRLAAYGAREAGTDSCRAAGEWIVNAFRSYGYDSAYVDSHLYITNPHMEIVDTFLLRNIVACKIGSRFPERQIVIGAHYDAAPGCPGADDNASGTSGVLEIARIFADIETEMTVVFIAFDAEERGLGGSRLYATAARARGDDIIHMFNLDMIGHLTNDTLANLYVGSDSAYAQLWNRLADSLVDITGTIISSTGLSDEYSFRRRGYSAMFIQEYDFSTVYHCLRGISDDTTFINFDYLTRMIQATAATAYTVTQLLPPVVITAVGDMGDGQSLDITWRRGDPSQVDHYQLFYADTVSLQPESLTIPGDSSHYVLSGLSEGMTYTLYLVPYDAAGQSAITVEKATGVPHSLPDPPQNLSAKPVFQGVRLSWEAVNVELDFSHYVVYRDGMILPDSIADSVYIDDDLNLGSSLHEYRVRAMDRDGNLSDTTGIAAVSMKAATLQPGRILAVNRSRASLQSRVDAALTGAFLCEALDGFNYDYHSDTVLTYATCARLTEMIDYAVVVVGSENAIGDHLQFADLLSDIAYYLSIGGKAIIFHRGGSFLSVIPWVDSLCFEGSGFTDSCYLTAFNMACQGRPITLVDTTGFLTSDLIGAHSRAEGYPDLVWDSAATMHHTGSNCPGVTGIPFPSFAILGGAPVDTLYTYDSRTDSVLTEGQINGWRSLDKPYEYVFFEFPLTFMNHDAAIAALRKAVNDMGILTAVDDGVDIAALPNTFTLAQNYPNPFNPATTIEFRNPEARPVVATVTIYNILGQEVRRVFDGPALPGLNRVVWDGRDERGRAAASGIYFYRLRTGDVMLTRRMILLK